METIKVNMNPNPLDVQTIHASQNDGEAREWGFELHNNGDVIDASEISDQLVFKAYKGGTEQLLPENGSTPTTSPFLGDIKYLQGLLTDQEFTYRQSPTEEDGLAKITDIKGNTIVWNQQVPIPTRDSATTSGITVTNNRDGSLTLNGTPSNKNINWWIWGDYATNVSILSLKASHKYFVKDCILYSETGAELLKQYIGASPVIWSPSTDYELGGVRVPHGDTNKTYTNVKIYPMIIDLTQMGLDITDPSDFTSLFSLPYYAYNQGSLLSFNGTGLKTVGANLILFANGTRTGTGITGTVSNGVFSASGTATSTYANLNFFNELKVKNGEVYTVGLNKALNYGITFRFATDTTDSIFQQVTIPAGSQIVKFTANNDYNYVRLYISGISSGTAVSFSGMIPMIANADLDAFEPYTSSTLSLPVSTYFPTGMKSAGTVYDELTPNKAVTRLIKTIVDGTNVQASYFGTYQGHQLFYADLFATTYVDYSNMSNLKSNHYLTAINVTMDDRYIRYQAQNNMPNIGRIYWNDDRYTSASAMNTALQSDPLEIISLAQTPTETSFTTASLVTENAEIPLSNEDGVLIGKCTEQLSENPGFIDAKIKLSDADGECYSNKIQLHVERSPQ